jgi:SAM-dependent methyltransferase
MSIPATNNPIPEQPRAGLSQRIFAWVQSQGDPPAYLAVVEGHKRRLFSSLSGTVVEIGPGTGDNFPYYPAGIQWIGIEPNVFMHPKLREAAEKHGIAPAIRTMTAERLPLEDNSVDAVVSTLVLCSVSDQAVTLREILRVLKPGGRYVFVEHVAAPRGTWLRRVQSLIKPGWKLFTDGCNPDRETGAVIESAGFSSVEIQRFTAPVPIASPHIAGAAVK